MKVRFAPEGADPREWDFNPTKLLNVEAEAIERHTGMSYGEWSRAIQRGSMTALHGLLFIMLKRSTPTLRWDDVVFCLDDIDFVVEDQDARDIVKALRAKEAAGDLEDQEREVLDRLVAQGVEDAPPAAPAEGGGSAPFGGPSPTE